MCATSRLLPKNLKWYIIHQVEEDKKDREIIENVKNKYQRAIYPSTIKRLWDEYKETGSIACRKSSGRPQLFNAADKTKIVKEVRRKKTLTGVDVAKNKNLNVPNAHKRTLQRLLKARRLISSTGVPRYIKPINRRKRVAFAEEYRVKTKTFWNNCFFTDECDLFPKKSGKRRIRKYKGEEVDVNLGPDYKWDHRTVKVLGVIGRYEVGPLIRYHGTIDSEKYMSLIAEHVTPEYKSLKGTSTRPAKLVLVHDGASAHKSNPTTTWSKQNKINHIDCHRRAPI